MQRYSALSSRGVPADLDTVSVPDEARATSPRPASAAVVVAARAGAAAAGCGPTCAYAHSAGPSLSLAARASAEEEEDARVLARHYAVDAAALPRLAGLGASAAAPGAVRALAAFPADADTAHFVAVTCRPSWIKDRLASLLRRWCRWSLTDVNALLGRAVSAVSRKYNTTRRRTLGVLTEGSAQLELVDTPGFVRAEGEGGFGGFGGGGPRYHKALVAAARDAVPESDLVLLVLDAARRFDDEARAALGAMVGLAAANGAGVLLVANKCDLLRGVALDQRQRQTSHGKQIVGTRREPLPSALNDSRVFTFLIKPGDLFFTQALPLRMCVEGFVVPGNGIRRT